MNRNKTRLRILYICFIVGGFMTVNAIVGCTYRRGWDPKDSRPAVKIPDKYAKLADIVEEKHDYIEKIVEEKSNYTLIDVTIKVNGEEATKLAWYRSKNKDLGEPRPVDFIWPILVGRSMPVASLFGANIFAPIGVDAVVIRQKEKLLSRRNPKSLKEMIPFHYESIRHLLRAAKWASTKKEMDSSRFGLTGTSYGGIMTALCIPFAPKFISYKVVMGAGNIASILDVSIENKVVRWRKALFAKMAKTLRDEIKAKSEERYYKHKKMYEQWIAAEVRKKFIEEAEEIEYDPIKLAKYGDPKQIAMIITLNDKHVPTNNQIELWKAFGKPETLFVRTGHYTLIMAYFQIKSFIGEMAKKHYRQKPASSR